LCAHSGSKETRDVSGSPQLPGGSSLKQQSEAREERAKDLLAKAGQEMVDEPDSSSLDSESIARSIGNNAS